MEKEKIVIKDSKRKKQLVVFQDHPFFNNIKNSLMPDEYRSKMKRMTNVEDGIIEELIASYYEQIEMPNVVIENENGDSKVVKDVYLPFKPLVVYGTMVN